MNLIVNINQFISKYGILLKAAWTIAAIIVGVSLWVGSIQIRVGTLEKEQEKVSKKVELIQGDTQYMRGRIDAKWGKE